MEDPMTTRIRSHAAAALLLLPLGLAGLAQPAAAQPSDHRGHAVAPARLIEDFDMRPNGRLHAGQEVRFRLEAVRGARAWVDVPGVVGNLQLREVRPGRYEGDYVIRRNDDLDAFRRAVATVQYGPQRQSARVDQRGNDRDDRWGRDERAPQITDVTPAQGARVSERGRTRVAARFDDAGRAGVDLSGVQLRIDGVDVTARSRVSAEGVEFSGDLVPGRHSAELAVRDRAGNVARRTWSFDVLAAHVPTPAPVPVAALQITSHANGTTVDVNRPVTLHGRTAPRSVVTVQLRPVLLGQDLPEVQETVRADANGNFSVRFPGMNLQRQPTLVDVIVTADVPGSAQVQQRLRLAPRG
jgi:hypothetical protein